MAGFFSANSPTLYTLPHNVSFVDELASAILELFAHNPLELADLTVYLPNRRSVRELSKSILRETGGKPTLLPSLIAIGDLSDDEQVLSSFLGAYSIGDEKLNPPIPELTRQTLLTTQILRVAPKLGLGEINPAEGVALAKTLCQFLDQVQNESCSLDDLEHLAPEELAEHWQKVLQFLEIVGEHWPKILEESGFSDPVTFRNHQINLLTEHLANNPSAKPIIAAGSTGSNPSTAKLLRAIANQPLGAVILPALDVGLDDETWDAIANSPTHPQHIMHKLLHMMQINRHEINPWPFALKTADKTEASNERVRFLKEALRPAETVPHWLDLKFDVNSYFHNMSYVKCPSPREEAGVVALIMRQTLEDEGKTVALVTPDRTLANRVGAELARWGIEVDDSAGTPLATSPPATFIRLLAEATAHRFSPVALLSLLKHPFACNGMTRMELLTLTRQLESKILRGQKPAAGFSGILSAIEAHNIDARKKDSRKKTIAKDIINFVKGLKKTLQPLANLFHEEQISFNEFIENLIDCAQGLAAQPDKKGEEVLWAGHDGNALSSFFSELLDASKHVDSMTPEQAPALLDALLGGRNITKSYGTHPRISIWGTLEARLKHADVMILSGLNEGSWPPQVMDDPWMSRPMKTKMKLSPSEKRIGQSALDFLGACGGETVILTRAEKSEGAPTVPSRWLLRMEALAATPQKSEPWLNWFQVLDRPSEVCPTLPPSPTPPVDSRPQKFSVSAVQNWMSDPYSIYAQYILNLAPLDQLEAEPDAALRGTVIHEALETFMEDKTGNFKLGDIDELLDHGKKAFDKFLPQSSVYSFWWPRFVKAAEAFIGEQIARNDNYQTIGNEVWGNADIETTAGIFKIYGKADRIDLNVADQTLEIIDYKTGKEPSKKQIIAGFKPQLPMLGLMAENGGLENISQTNVGQFAYWIISGGTPPVAIKTLKGLDTGEEIERTEAGLKSLYVDFQNVKTPYLSKPRPIEVGYGTYDHLARVKEWQNEEQSSDSKGDAE
ncbi:MAG: double-strand break repair protein AddB [Sphingomonadales bacterium]|nr:double-strand break repair protein AddB [Sphingomonadales bacterium]